MGEQLASARRKKTVKHTDRARRKNRPHHSCSSSTFFDNHAVDVHMMRQRSKNCNTNEGVEDSDDDGTADGIDESNADGLGQRPR